MCSGGGCGCRSGDQSEIRAGAAPVAASCRTGRKDRTQLHDALLSRGPIAKTGATLRSVRKKLQGHVRAAAGDLPAEADERLAAASALLWWCDCNVNSEKRRAGKAPSRLYGTGSWAGGNRGRRAGEDGSWLFPVKGIPAHSPRGASTRKNKGLVQRETVKQAKRSRASVTARRPCLLTRRRRLRRRKGG